MKSFLGKVAAITGVGSGIGCALALRLARCGCHLALCDVDERGLAGTVESARRAGVKVTGDRVDVADRGAVYRWADRVAEEHGRVNLVFNNAGVALGSAIEGGGYEDFEWLFGINFWGVVHGTKAFLPHLRASGEGHVVNVSSVFALISVPGQGAYNASKAAVRGFTDALRMELEMSGAPISATSVQPGGIDTNIARNSRGDTSIEKLGLDAERGREKFDELLVTDADEAARTILRAVKKNKRVVAVRWVSTRDHLVASLRPRSGADASALRRATALLDFRLVQRAASLGLEPAGVGSAGRRDDRIVLGTGMSEK